MVGGGGEELGAVVVVAGCGGGSGAGRGRGLLLLLLSRCHAAMQATTADLLLAGWS